MQMTLENPDGTSVGTAFQADLDQIGAAQATSFQTGFSLSATHVLRAPASAPVAVGLFVQAGTRRYQVQATDPYAGRCFPAGETRWYVQEEGYGA